MKRYGRMFLLDRDTVTLRNDAGESIFFKSVEEFNRFFPALDLSGKSYIDYEPDRGQFIDDSGSAGKSKIPDAKYEEVLASFEQLKEARNDPFHGAGLADAQAVKRSQILRKAEHLSRIALPAWKVGLVLFDDVTEDEKKQTKERFLAIWQAARAALTELERTASVDEVKRLDAAWPATETDLCEVNKV